MIIVLVGKSGAGKTTIKEELVKLGFNSIVTYTTRPIREGEIDGVDYHFISDEEFHQLGRESFFFETTNYNTIEGIWHYGTSRESLYSDNSVLIVNPSGLNEIRKQKIPCVVFYIDNDMETLVNRLIERGDDEEEMLRRLANDEKDFENITSLIDFTYKNINISPSDLAKLISIQFSQFSKTKRGE